MLASFAYYYFSHIQETPITKRRRFIAFTPEQFEVLNKLEFDQQIETYKSKLLPTEHADTQRVGRVVRQLLAGNEDIEQIKRHDWSVSVINDESVMNAFVMPSGNIFVFSGLLKMVDNDDQLGMILAHEISHAILGHGLENVSVLFCFVFTANLSTSFTISRSATSTSWTSSLSACSASSGCSSPRT